MIVMRPGKAGRTEIKKRKNQPGKSGRAYTGTVCDETAYKTVMEVAPIATAIIQDSRIKYANQNFVKMFGCTLKELLSWKAGKFVRLSRPESRKFMEDQAEKKQAGKKGVVQAYNLRIVEKNGNVKWARLSRKAYIYVEETIRDMRVIAEKRSIDISLFDDVDNKIMYIDKGRIQQVITNLINNSLKFSPENSGVDVEAFNPEETEMPGKIKEIMQSKKNYIAVCVADAGRGIDREFQERVFDRFFQVDNPDVREHAGTGLGLSIAKSIVEAHNGYIWCESEGKGREAKFCSIVQEE